MKNISFINHLFMLPKKKSQNFLPFFQTSSPFSRLFPDLENCWANFKTFSRTNGSLIGCIFHSTECRVRTLLRTKNSRTFQGLSRTFKDTFPIFKDSIQYKKSLEDISCLDRKVFPCLLL